MTTFIKTYITILFIVVCSLANNVLAVQKPTIELKVDTNEILIGDQIDLQVKLTYPTEKEVFFPEYEKNITKDIEVIEKYPADTLQIDANTQQIVQKYLITAFDSGLHYIPEVTALLRQQDAVDSIKSNTAFIIVGLDTIVDITGDFKDIKTPLKLPFTFKELVPYLLAILAIALIVFIVLYILKRRKNKQPILKPSKPQEPLHIIALRKLNEMEGKKEWNTVHHKKYYTKLTDILRTYIEGRFKVLALEQTTTEILRNLPTTEINSNLKSSLEEILTLADLVKFAKYIPNTEDNKRTLVSTITFVNDTILQVVEETAKTTKQE